MATSASQIQANIAALKKKAEENKALREQTNTSALDFQKTAPTNTQNTATTTSSRTTAPASSPVTQFEQLTASGVGSKNAQSKTFADVVQGAGSKTFKNQFGKEENIYKEFEYQGERYAFDPSGNLTVVGKAQTQGTGDKVVGIDSSGKTRYIGETSSRLPILKNVRTFGEDGQPGVFIAGGTDPLDDLRAAAAPRATLDGELTGEQKLARLREAGLMGGTSYTPGTGATKTSSDLVNVDFASEMRLFDNPPKAGEGEDPLQYQLRLAKWERGQVTDALNVVKQEIETKKLSDSIKDVVNVSRATGQVKSPSQIRAELNNDPEFNVQFNNAKKAYSKQRMATAQQAADARTRNLKGSSESIEAVKKAVLEEETEKAKNDIASYNSEVETLRKDSLEKIVNDTSLKVGEFENMSQEDFDNLMQENEFKGLVDNFTAQINPNTGVEYTPLEADAMAKKALQNNINTDDSMAALKTFNEGLVAGTIDRQNPVDMFQQALDLSGGDSKKALNLLGSSFSNDVAKKIQTEWINSLGLPGELTVQKQTDAQNQSNFLTGKLDTDVRLAYMDKLEVDSPQKAIRVYEKALENDTYADNPDVEALIMTRLGRLTEPETKDRDIRAFGDELIEITDEGVEVLKTKGGKKKMDSSKSTFGSTNYATARVEDGDFEKAEGISMRNADFANPDHVATLLSKYSEDDLDLAYTILNPQSGLNVKNAFSGVSESEQKKNVNQIITVLKNQMLASDDGVGFILASSGGKELNQTSLDGLSKALNVIEELGNLEQLMDAKAEEAFISNYVAGKNPFDASGRQINATITGLVPNVARGLFGEVGVLTDQDIANYKQLFPRLEDTQAVRDLMLSGLYRTAQRSFLKNLEVLAAGDRDISGFAPMYKDLQDTADSYFAKAQERTPDVLLKDKPQVTEQQFNTAVSELKELFPDRELTQQDVESYLNIR